MKGAIWIPMVAGVLNFPGGQFKPYGGFKIIGSKKAIENPVRRPLGEKILSARIIVGLSVLKLRKGKPIIKTPYKMDDVIKFVKRVRIKQLKDLGLPLNPGASFVAQKGLFLHKKYKIQVQEDSVQVIIINITGETDNQFEKNLMDLSELLWPEFKQESILIEFQESGKFLKGFEVGEAL